MFIIDGNILARIKALLVHAEKNPYSMDDMLDVKNGAIPSPGDLPEFCLLIPLDVKVVLTVEEQPKGRIKHLSVSVSRPGRLPHPQIVNLLMHEMEFKYKLEECLVTTEQIGVDHEAINIYDYPRKPVVKKIVEGPLYNYVVYNQTTTDHPGKFVVRLFEYDNPKDLVALADTLEEARRAIPPGLTCLTRHPDDEPQIVETWL